jgi:hypothetical protein
VSNHVTIVERRDLSICQQIQSAKLQTGVTRDRCYDFKNIFAEKIAKKLVFFTQNKGKLCKILIITLVFEKNANFLPKIGKNRRKL